MAIKLPRKTPFANLRPTEDYALEWEAVEDRAVAASRMDLDLTAQDRLALGLTPEGATPAHRPSKDEDARVVLSRLH